MPKSCTPTSDSNASFIRKKYSDQQEINRLLETYEKRMNESQLALIKLMSENVYGFHVISTSIGERMNTKPGFSVEIVFGFTNEAGKGEIVMNL